MKAKEVLKLLKVTRPTLTKYIRIGKIKGKMQTNKQYIYDKESVFKLLDKDLIRANVIYARVSTNKQKQDLENQVELIKEFCNKNGIIINDIYKDTASGISIDRKELKRLIEDVIEYKINKIFITYKDRLLRISFDMFKDLFLKFETEIIVLNDIEDSKILEKEIFQEIIDLIHCFAMKMYSNRRKEKMKLLEKELELEKEVE